MNEKTCKTCVHFRQHYTKREGGVYFEAGSGHCVYPRCKPRRKNTPACDKYKEKAL